MRCSSCAAPADASSLGGCGEFARRVTLGFLTGLVVAMWCPTSWGEDSPLVLSWTAPDGCPGQAAVAGDVQSRLGGATTGRAVAARAVVTQVRRRLWRVVLDTQQDAGEGRRVIEAATCAELASATALVLALTIDPSAALSKGTPGPAEPAPPPPPPLPPPMPPAPVVVERAPPPLAVPPPRGRRPEIQLSARLLPMVGIGTSASAVSFGGSIGVGVEFGRLSAEASGTTYLPQSHDVSATHAGGTLWPSSAGLAACGAAVDTARGRAGGCGGFEYERLDASGYGVTAPASGSAAWGAPSMSAFLAARVYGALWLHARSDLTIPLVRARFALHGVGDVFDVPSVAGRVGVGAEVRF